LSFVRLVDRQRRFIGLVIALLVLGGVFSAFRLPVTLFPQTQFPRIVVLLDAGHRPAKQMELEVTRPVELAIRGVLGVRGVRSTTSRGSAEIDVDFDWGEDMVSKLLQVESAINQTLPQLPAGTVFQAQRRDPTVFPVIAYSLTSDTQSLVQLRDLADYQLVPLLSSIEGVATIGVLGGQVAEYRVSVDPARLDAFRLTLHDVAQALSVSNVLTAVGLIEDHYKLYLEVVDTRLQSLDQIRRTVLRSGQNGLVELEDVADVRAETAPNWQRVTADGHNAVLVQVYQQPGASVVRLSHDIGAALQRYASHIPSGIHINQWYDQSQIVKASEASVRNAILIGIALAGLVLLGFLRNLELTLVAVITVPAVLAATLLLLFVFGMSLNIMTLGGIAAAVGLIIDDVIVMIEHIVRRVHESGEPSAGRILAAVWEFTPALTGSSVSTIIIFVPLAFLTGVTGAFFKALSLTMASALLISFLIAWLAVPLLMDYLLCERNIAAGNKSAIARRLERAYRHLMVRLLRRPLWVLIGVIPLLSLAFVAYKQLGAGFIPTIDEGGFVLDYVAPAGTSLTETDRLLWHVETILQSTPEVQTYSRRTGVALGGGITEANAGDFFVRLKPRPPRTRDTEAVMRSVRQRVATQVPGLEIEVFQLIEDEIGDLTGVPQPIEIKLFGNDDNELRALAPKVAHAISRLPGVVDVKDGVVLAGDSLVIDVDRTKAALEGMDPDSVTAQVNVLLSGLVTTEVQSRIKFVGVRVWVSKALRANTDQIGALRLRAPDGHLLPLSRIADITTVTGQPEITRENLKPMVAVTARISNRALGPTIQDVRQALSRPGLVPHSVYYALGGLYQQQQIAFRGLIAVFAAAIALVFALLLLLYQRFTTALIIMIAPLMATGAAFIGLWLTGIELNISAMMGMTMIVGIVTEVAIFYFSELTAMSARSSLARSLIQAGINRARPIAMTTFAAILALLPLALALGDGAAMQQPLAVAIISGLAVQMPLVLLLLPVMHKALCRK
jgi:CzcA family heavy metal efflux pump